MPRSFTLPSGTALRCRGWRQEGLLRLLENVLAIGEVPDDLVVYAALGKAARNWESHDAIVDALKTIHDDETLVVQSGKPIGVLKTHERAPIVLMANCNIVGRWATAEHFYDLEKRGLICWGGLTAGDWQYIGSQGVIQGTYEILARIAEQHFGGTLAAWAEPSHWLAACQALQSCVSRSTRHGSLGVKARDSWISSRKIPVLRLLW